MKKLLTLALLALLIGCTEELPEPKTEQGKPRKKVYDREELPKVRRVGRN